MFVLSIATFTFTLTFTFTCEARFFGIWLIERVILHLNRASCSLWLIQRGMLHLKCTQFWYMAYRTRNITCEASFLVYGL